MDAHVRPSRTPKRIFLGAESFARKNSGIARVARLMLKSILLTSKTHPITVDALALSDVNAEVIDGSLTRTANGSRMRFFLTVQYAAVNHDWFLFDFLGIARARSVI